ncbi:MAG: hypothetical protein JNJ85_13075 [Candidatus Kapabacteria bacterium]|nr:hypothetical protein [Candidatus Kapabacteria bacterium]
MIYRQFIRLVFCALFVPTIFIFQSCDPALAPEVHSTPYYFLFVSTNGGEHWYQKEISGSIIGFVPNQAAMFSTDHGEGFSKILISDMFPSSKWDYTGMSDPDRFCATSELTSEGEIWCSFERKTYRLNQTSLIEAYNGTVKEIRFLRSNSQYGCINTGQGILYTSDAGQTWNQSETHLGGSLSRLVLANDSTYFIYSDSLFLHQSTDHGKTWTNLGSNSMEYYNYSLYDSTGFYLSTDGTLYRSTDYAAHWTEFTLPMFPDLTAQNPEIFESIASGTWVVGEHGVIYKTNDEGKQYTNNKFYITTYINDGSKILHHSLLIEGNQYNKLRFSKIFVNRQNPNLLAVVLFETL